MSELTERIFNVYTWTDDCNRAFVHHEKTQMDKLKTYNNKEEAESAAIVFCKNHVKKCPNDTNIIKYEVYLTISATEHWTPETIEKVLLTGSFINMTGSMMKY